MTAGGGTVASIWRRDRRRCWICSHGVAIADATRDHVEPRSHGGYDKSKNYRLAHARCNVARGNLSEAVVRSVQAENPDGSAETIRQALLRKRRAT